MDCTNQVLKVTRVVQRHNSQRTVSLTQYFDVMDEVLWDAITDPEQLEKWFAPVAGNLKFGGDYAINGNASGTITGGEMLRNFSLTWNFAGKESTLDIQLLQKASQESSATGLELKHTFEVDEHWDKYGPGAGGVGWDMSLAGLALYLNNKPRPSEEEWAASTEAKDFVKRASEAWLAAAIKGGEDESWAKAAAERTTAFYTGTE